MRSYIYNIMVSIDQFGNSLAGGYCDNTISARVGSFAHEESPYQARTYSRWYWKMMQFIIDRTFYPVDGEGHCHKAFHKEAGSGFNVGSDILKFILSFIIIGTCIPIFVVLHLLWMFQLVKPRPQELSDIAIGGFKKIDRMLESGEILTEESDELPMTLIDKARETHRKLEHLITRMEGRVP